MVDFLLISLILQWNPAYMDKLEEVQKNMSECI